MFCCLKNCGICCCPVPIKREIYEANKDRLAKDSKVFEFDSMVIVQAPTGECGFLNGEKRCSIYEDRPEVCRLFGDSQKAKFVTSLMCPFLRVNGEPRPRKERRILREIQKSIEKDVRKRLEGGK